MNTPIALVIFGLIVGVFSGVMGLGGGSIMIPIMVLIYGMTQQQAHGTSLAVMVPPVALLGVMHYYKQGNVKIAMAAWIALGVVAGTYFGARFANSLPKEQLKLIFGFVLIYVAAYTVFGKEGHLLRTVLIATTLVAIAVGMWAMVRWHDGRAVTSATTPAATVTTTSATQGA